MTSNSSRQPSELDRYLARRGFTSRAGNSTWLDRDTGQQIIRVVRQPGEQTELISLTPHSACLYHVAFSLETPDAVINAAVEAALSPPPPQAGQRQADRPRASGAHKNENGGLR